MDGEQNSLNDGQDTLPLPALVESLLFVASEPSPIERLASVLQVTPEQVEEALRTLDEQ